MRRIAAGLLLATQLTWATPGPSLERFDWPGQQKSGTDQIRYLDGVEREFRRKSDPTSLVEIECLRLQSMVSQRLGVESKRLEAIKDALSKLPPGRVHGRCLWLLASLEEDQKARLELAKEALQEPGLHPIQQALWLNQVSHWDMGIDDHRWLLRKVASLSASEPEPELDWCLLGIHQGLASLEDKLELSRQLSRSRAQLCH